MSFADPQSVTVNAVAISLPRTSSGVNSGVFTSADGNSKLSVSHSYGKRTRRTIRLDSSKVAADPLLPTQNVKLSNSVYLVVDAPVAGFTNTSLSSTSTALLPRCLLLRVLRSRSFLAARTNTGLTFRICNTWLWKLELC
jgi:hypothetical protein